MSRIKGIEQLKGKGIKVRIIDDGKIYSTYREFARAVGYPSAIKYEWHPDKKRFTYDVLAKGKHGYEDKMLYVVENEMGERFIFDEKGLTFIYENNKEESTINNLNEMTYGELTDHARIVLDELRTKAYAEGYKQGKFDQRMDAAFKDVKEVVEEKTQQERRDEIVERAKADIEELKRETAIGEFYDVFDDYFMNFPNRCYADFKVNRDKRTVVCLLRGYNSNEIYARGIAKCAPNDCFNVHIGKAIALRRALGIEVPDEYLNAPQPTEIRKGDIIRMKSYNPDNTAPDHFYERKVKIFYRDKVGYVGGGFDYRKNVDKEAKIIDDSREGDDD